MKRFLLILFELRGILFCAFFIFLCYRIFWPDIYGSLFEESKSVMSEEVRIDRKATNSGVVYAPIYVYRVDGFPYSCKLDYSDKMPTEENIEIYYKSTYPNDCLNNNIFGISYNGVGLLIVALIFCIGPTYLFVRYTKSLGLIIKAQKVK